MLALTRADFVWKKIPLGVGALSEKVAAFRHGLDVDETGTRLAMGSTTGALWTSDTGGEAWALVNAHLPPIYSVRFR